MSDSFQTIEVVYSPQTATVWMNRPDVRNALSPTLIAELTRAFQALGEDPAIRAVVLAGHGKAFCAGADLNRMKESAQAPEAENRADAQALATLLYTVHTCPKPVIARIHGPCMAGGLGLISACDIAVAAREAKFALTETRLGLIPATISPYVLRAMGERAARRWFLTGEVITAAEAWRMGLVHELCEAGEIDQRVHQLLESFMLASPSAPSSAPMSSTSTRSPRRRRRAPSASLPRSPSGRPSRARRGRSGAPAKRLPLVPRLPATSSTSRRTSSARSSSLPARRSSPRSASRSRC